jgi:tripartite-type tricarboxylate transporter receptor subunit TctC
VAADHQGDGIQGAIARREKSFTPVATLAAWSHVLVANEVSARTVAEFVAHAKANPNKHALGNTASKWMTRISTLDTSTPGTWRSRRTTSPWKIVAGDELGQDAFL